MMMLARTVLRAVLLLAVVFAWSGDVSAQLRKELRVGVLGVPATLDPAAALDGAGALISRQVFDTLVAYREGSTDVEPALAVRWTVSRDGLVWSFVLRDGVRFHDGSPLTAGEAAASFERQIQAPVAAPSPVWAALLRGNPGVIREVRASDARTLHIVLVQPYAPLLTNLAHPGLSIARAVTAPDGTVRLVGTGPYRVVDASAGRMALEAAPGHWAGHPRTERIVVLDVAGDDHAEAEFDARSLDIWFPPAPPRRAAGALSMPGTRVGYLAFQTEKEPFKRKKLRQAVAGALDPAVLSVALDRAAVPLPSFLPVGVWGRREGSPVLGGTRTAVKALLRDGGWPKGERPTMVAASDTEGVNVPRLAEAVQLMLGAADIPIEVRLEPASRMRTALQEGEHEMSLVEGGVTGGDPHLFLFPLSTSEGATKGVRALNFSFYRDARLDDVLIRASQLANRTERVRLYQRAQGILADEVPWIPVYVRLLWGVARPEVRNLRLHPTGFHRLSTVSLEAPAGATP
ncbi:MAG TPA: ABC transporter substrate-binding protein [Candidatus Limnocylindria bacterium]|nr:ABC transporter substrate-binding protein [Candidatus Limnocylindria bacterium]